MHVLIFHRLTFVRCRNIFPTTNSLITNIQYFISSFLYFTSCYIYIYNDIADSLFIVSGIGIKLTYFFLIQVRQQYSTNTSSRMTKYGLNVVSKFHLGQRINFTSQHQTYHMFHIPSGKCVNFKQLVKFTVQRQ